MMVKLLKLYFVPLLDLGKKQKWIEMDPRWQVVHTQAADRKYERAGSSREKERSAFCKLGEMGLTRSRYPTRPELVFKHPSRKLKIKNDWVLGNYNSFGKQ